MVDNILSYLEQLDLSAIEAKLYLKLLETGPISVKDLAKQVGIKRTTAYVYIDQLIENGLIIKVVKGTKQQVAATEPEITLKSLIDKKMQTAKKVQEDFPQILKSIQHSLQPTDISNAEIRYYKGKYGVKKIYEEALKAKELRTYFNIETIKYALPDNEDLFIDALKRNTSIKIYELFQDTSESKKMFVNFHERTPDQSNYFFKFLPVGVVLSAADILIYEGHVAIVTVRNQISGIVLKNIDYYNNTKELFDLIWKVLPEAK